MRGLKGFFTRAGRVLLNIGAGAGSGFLTGRPAGAVTGGAAGLAKGIREQTRRQAAPVGRQLSQSAVLGGVAGFGTRALGFSKPSTVPGAGVVTDVLKVGGKKLLGGLRTAGNFFGNQFSTPQWATEAGQGAQRFFSPLFADAQLPPPPQVGAPLGVETGAPIVNLETQAPATPGEVMQAGLPLVPTLVLGGAALALVWFGLKKKR